MKRLTGFVPLFALLLAAAGAAEKTLVNVDRSGLALKGYDPVAFFTQDKPLKGDAGITAAYRGATYRFASQANKELFEQDPARYEPQFGGFCAYAVSINKTADIDPQLFEIVNGRLILQHNQKAWDLWHRDPQNNLVKADSNWPGLIARLGK